MIIENGFIQVKKKTSGGIDPETGHPVQSSDVSWGKPIPCQFYANSYNNVASVNGEPVKRASFTILIEWQPFNAERIRLSEWHKTIGEYSVISAEPLEAVGQIRIII